LLVYLIHLSIVSNKFLSSLNNSKEIKRKAKDVSKKKLNSTEPLVLTCNKKLSRDNSKESKGSRNSLKRIGTKYNHNGTVRLDIKGHNRILYSQLRQRVLPNENINPMTPGTALKLLAHKLNNYEKEEIFNYSDVYFVGRVEDKSLYDKIIEIEGYDDKKGNYKIVPHDHIAYRYEVLKVLGKGSFGQAIKCFDHKRKVTVAIKIIKNNKKFHEQAEIEERILRYIKEHDINNKVSIVQIHDSFIFRNHIVLLHINILVHCL